MRPQKKKLCIIDIRKFPPFPDVVPIWYLLSAVCLSEYRSVYNLPISRVLGLPRQSSFILCTFQSCHLLSYGNKRSSTKVPLPFLADGRMLRRDAGAAPSQLEEQVVGRSPGETPEEQTWPVGSLRYCRRATKMTSAERHYIPSDNSILGLDKCGDLPILIRFLLNVT